MTSQTFEAVVEGTSKRVFIRVPFDADHVWGPKPRHHVAGTIHGKAWRGPLDGDAPAALEIRLGPAWRRDCGRLEVGDRVVVDLAPEGPQRGALAPDVAAALDASPRAAAFFDSLAQFYRKGYLT